MSHTTCAAATQAQLDHARIAEEARGLWCVSFFVPGEPQAKGSYATIRNGTGAIVGVREADSRTKSNWRAHAAEQGRAAWHAAGNATLMDWAVRVRLEVLRVRPKGHFGSGRNAGILKASAPRLPTSAPDLDKLQRSLGDALNGVLWRDDALISTWIVTRRWADEAGIRVTVEPDVVGLDVAVTASAVSA